MNFRMSMFVDAFLGSGVPLSGDPITSVEKVPLIGLRTTTVVNNCKPMVQDVVKVRLLATNCGERPIEIVPHCHAGRQRHQKSSEENAITLLPGESSDYSVFRSWEAPGEHQLALVYEARCAGQPFAQLSYPTVAIHVLHPDGSNLMQWLLCARAVMWPNKSLQPTAATMVA